MKNCIYIAFGANLPDQNASALRVTSIINSLIDKGFSFDVIGQGPGETSSCIKVCEGYNLLPTYNTKKKNSILEKVFAFFFPTRRIFVKIKSIIEKKKIDYIFIYQLIPISLMRKIIRVSKKYNIRIIFDIVEYQNLSQQRSLRGVFFNYLPARKIIEKYSAYGRVISISTYLTEKFKTKGLASIFVPFFFDVKSIPINNHHQPSNDLRIVYAGAPFGSRDTIANAVKALMLLENNDRSRIHFTFAGFTRDQMRDLGLSNSELLATDSYCEYLGRIPHEKVIEIYSHSDYSLLLKPENKRLSKAGFPTKVSESWSLSTPVIANLTGDMNIYMKDMFNGIVSKSDSPKDFSEALIRALNVSKTDYASMRLNSRLTAENKLDKSVFGKIIADFLEE